LEQCEAVVAVDDVAEHDRRSGLEVSSVFEETHKLDSLPSCERIFLKEVPYGFLIAYEFLLSEILCQQLP
jgi:hypothetical protein